MGGRLRPKRQPDKSDRRRGQVLTFEYVVVHTLDRWSRNLKVTLDSFAILAKHGVSLVSITEQIDYSTPQGKLFTQMLGSFAEYFSESLATHVRKGQSQHAEEGRHLGGIPFGYESCWQTKDATRQKRCEPEHPGGVHVVSDEADAVRELFMRYSVGMTTTTRLAAWLNERGFRTRNTKILTGAEGEPLAGPRLFTGASVRNILHNPFYAGFIRHAGLRKPGAHEAIVTSELFEGVQAILRKNSGRSETLSGRSSRTYLLKGLIRCAYCGFPLWAQTYKNGSSYYREQYGTRSFGTCPAERDDKVPDSRRARWQDHPCHRIGPGLDRPRADPVEHPGPITPYS